MKIVREGALPVGGDSGLAEVRDRAERGFGDSSARGDVREEDIWPGFRDKVLSFVDVDAMRPLRVVIDAANGMAGAMLPPVLERLPIEAVPLLLRAGRHLPEPRAEPAPPREPRVHRREDARGGRRPGGGLRRRRRPLLLRRRHGRVRPRRLRHRAARGADAREGAGREDHLRRPRELGRARHRPRARRRAAGQPRRPRLHQAPDAGGGRRLRRRGLRPLLLPRVLEGRLGRDPVPADARAALETRHDAVGAPAPVPFALLPHRRAQHAGRRRRREAARARGAVRRAGDGLAPRRRLRRGRGLALQRPPVEHRAAAAPQPGGDRLRGADGAEAGRGARRDPRRGARAARRAPRRPRPARP